MLPSKARKPASLGLASTARSASEIALAVSPATSAAEARVARPILDVSTLPPKIEALLARYDPGLAQPARTPIIAIADTVVPKRSGLVMIIPCGWPLGQHWVRARPCRRVRALHQAVHQERRSPAAAPSGR